MCGCVTDIMHSSLDTGVSDTLDPLAILSDDEIPSEREVYTSDTTSTDDDDFQPFALPDVGAEPADGHPAGDLPLAVIPAPIPLAAYPAFDLPLDVVSVDGIDLLRRTHLRLTMRAGPLLLLMLSYPSLRPLQRSFQLIHLSQIPSSLWHLRPYTLRECSITLQTPTQTWRYQLHLLPHLSSSLITMLMMILILSFPLVLILTRIEFIHLDQPLEEPVALIDPLFDDPADFDMDFVDPELAVALEPLAAPDPALEHDPVHDDAPAIAPFVDDVPATDAPADAPLLIEDPVVAPFPDPVPVLFDRAPFATHVDPRYADTRNGWIDDNDDYPPFVRPVTPPVAPVSVLVSAPISAPIDIPLFPHTSQMLIAQIVLFTFLQDIPPPRPGEGSSRQPPVPAPSMLSSPFPFTSQIPSVTPPTAPSFTPSSEPFLWTTPPIMPLSDPYHPYHVGYSTEDILTSLMIYLEALTRRIQELERAQRPPCHCQTPFAASHPPRPLSPDSDVRFMTSKQQIAYLLRVCRALEQDWLHMRRLYYSRFPPPPPPSA
ncbi:hypothetical protein HanPI659440_Chr14g0525211 [Helianthus annuus]|nr:hypothetical protein HanPI659440_Chr14g0525211 [Helianthus annuus]